MKRIPFTFVLGLVAVAATLSASPASAQGYNRLTGAAPLVIGHRGASGYRPEHTLESYLLAIQLGADFIEPDLVMTRDGILIARHEPMLGGNINVASVFGPERKSTKRVDGIATTDYSASDFTLAEIKTLRAIQPSPNRPQEFNGLHQIPTFDEIISLAKAQSAATGRQVGIYPEVKHGTFHDGIFGARVFENKLISSLHGAYGNSGSDRSSSTRSRSATCKP